MLTKLFLKLTFVGAEWVMWILLLLSIVSIALMVERWLFFFRTKVDGDELAAQSHRRDRESKATSNAMPATVRLTATIVDGNPPRTAKSRSFAT